MQSFITLSLAIKKTCNCIYKNTTDSQINQYKKNKKMKALENIYRYRISPAQR